MKIEVHCPDCDDGYLVDAEAVEAGLPCVGCGRPLRGSGPVSPAVEPDRDVQATETARVQAPAETARAQAPAETARVEAPAETARVEASLPPSEVVCPRCNLHFKPRAEAQERVRRTAMRPTVLIVEDMVYFREVAAEALGDEYEVKTAATKSEALETLRQGEIDLMILDLTLDGGEGGLDLLRDLGVKPCPVVIYTAQDESEMYGDSWDELRELGADDIVLKGMNVGDELKRKVGALVGHDVDSDN